MTPDQTLNVAAVGAFFGLVIFAVLVGLLAAVYVAVCRAIDTHTARQAVRAQQPEPEPEPAIDEAVAVALAGACCEPWWTTCGLHHAHTCPTTTDP